MPFTATLSRRIRRALRLAAFSPLALIKPSWARARMRHHFADAASFGTRTVLHWEVATQHDAEFDSDRLSVAIPQGSETTTFVSSSASTKMESGLPIYGGVKQLHAPKFTMPRRILDPPPSLNDFDMEPDNTTEKAGSPVQDVLSSVEDDASSAQELVAPPPPVDGLSPPPAHYRRRKEQASSAMEDEDDSETDSLHSRPLSTFSDELMRFPF